MENYHKSDVLASLRCQINQKDREIQRLHMTLERDKGLPLLSQECSKCLQKDEKIHFLEDQLDAAMKKQHEAMSRALQLADRNQKLERELKDIDNMALAIEEECQSKVKQNLKNMDMLQEKLRHKVNEIKKLEATLKDMKNKIERDGQELENLKTEKKILEENFILANNEKKKLNDKVNTFLLTEKNLTSEISSLQDINKRMQQQIGEMEGKMMDVLGGTCRLEGKRKKHTSLIRVPNSKVYEGLREKDQKTSREEVKCRCNDLGFVDSHEKSTFDPFEKILQERDFYHKECHRLKDILGDLNIRFNSGADIMKELQDQQREIKDLKQQTYTLRRENCALSKRFECGDHLSCSSGDSIKIILDRLEKERDVALSDISRLQGERDALKEKIKVRELIEAAAESQIGEQSRLEKIIMENEERIRRLESERRELISNQSSQRIALSAAEEKCDEYREHARKVQAELTEMTANYTQLKVLQEQTDRTLSDLQSRLSQTVIELRFSTNKIKELEKEKEDLENEISVLKKEKSALKSNLVLMEKEKDGLLIDLDEKTEKAAKLESDIKKQEAYISELNEKISHIEKKFEFALNEKSSREQGLRTLERAVVQLKEELEECERHKEALLRENRRLQDDLASVSKDCLTARRDLDNEKQEVENLKRQLQQYVSEVKRAEELLTKKEMERNQMLEHFRSLSIEATTLETNNHTLESTVENTKSELTTANGKIIELEHQISSKDSLLYSYEKQIAELTTQIAEMESKLKQQIDLKNRAESDLTAMRDLCSAIDCQKETLRRQANSHDNEKTQLMNEVRRLSEEYEDLNQKLSYERSLSQSLEKSLSNSRQETLEHKITNKDLQSHVQQLRQKVDELNERLETESRDVKMYQAQCAELSQQVTELRREVTNARFEQAKAAEDSRRSEYSRTLESEEDCCYSLVGSSPTSARTFVPSTRKTKSLVCTADHSTLCEIPPLPPSSCLARDKSLSFALTDQVLLLPRFTESCTSCGSGFMKKCSEWDNCAPFSLPLPNENHSGRRFDKTKFLWNFPDSSEEVKEIRFEAEILRSSARNIPPLTFAEDSDRTVSLDSEQFYCEELGNTFRKNDWKLFPLLENSGCGSKTITFKADSTSDLSSLPEDVDHGNSCTNHSQPSTSEDKLSDLSPRPTYSVRGRFPQSVGTSFGEAIGSVLPLGEVEGNTWECHRTLAEAAPALECEVDKLRRALVDSSASLSLKHSDPCTSSKTFDPCSHEEG